MPERSKARTCLTVTLQVMGSMKYEAHSRSIGCRLGVLTLNQNPRRYTSDDDLGYSAVTGKIEGSGFRGVRFLSGVGGFTV